MTCRCTQLTSLVGSSSSGLYTPVSSKVLGGSGRKRLICSMSNMAANSSSVKDGLKTVR